ncbi:hypothetical protein, partial [Actinoplanes sp. NPDC049118]|uniref:hypothetical protein n=1 Tax=Actinoplanes sp. NPDC049118 TaxID=3155769 RepID=UPI0033FFDAF2
RVVAWAHGIHLRWLAAAWAQGIRPSMPVVAWAHEIHRCTLAAVLGHGIHLRTTRSPAFDDQATVGWSH